MRNRGEARKRWSRMEGEMREKGWRDGWEGRDR